MAVGTVLVPAASGVSATPSSVSAKPGDPGSLGIRLLDASVNRRDDPRSRIYINDHVPPGTTVVRHVEVSNTTDRPLDLKYYADAAAVTGGEFTPAAGHGTNELTGWTTVSPRTGTIAPGGRTALTVTIAVPKSAEPGERYGLVLAALPAPRTSKGQLGLGARVGVRMYLSVGDGTEPVSDFDVDSLTALRRDDGRPVVQAQVRNTGGRALDLAGTLDLDDGPGGLRAGPYPVELGTTLGIGQTAPVTVLLDKQLPAGPWHAVLELSSGRVTRAVEGTITFPSTPGTSAEPVPATPLVQRPNVVIPVAGGLLGLLAIAFLVLFLLWRRRKKDGDDEPSGSVGPGGPGTTAPQPRDPSPDERVRSRV